MDVLSEVLRAVRLTGAVYFDVRARAPWVAETPPLAEIAAKVMPELEHVLAFHLVLEGDGWAQLADGSEAPVRFVAGDALLFPKGDAHRMASDSGARAQPDLRLYRRPDDHPLPFVLKELGGSGAPVHLACGYLGCDARPFNPILDGLPRMLHATGSKRDENLTLELVRMSLEESASRRAGGETVLAKLSELLFVQALRRYVDRLPAGSAGWLSGLRDAHVGAALGLIHGRPAEDWTLERLAREVSLSRSVFAERFAHFVNESPMRYLARWRMQLALRLLESPDASIAQAAARVGYQSEAAFNRAFKKVVGVPPGLWRRTRLVQSALE